jgi:hypothetical protein
MTVMKTEGVKGAAAGDTMHAARDAARGGRRDEKSLQGNESASMPSTT